jgi:hypothetical protein
VAIASALRLQRRLQLAVVLVDGAVPAEVSVVMGDLFEALVGDAAPARDVAEKGDDVVLPLRAAESGEEDAVVCDGRLDPLGPRRRGGRGIEDGFRGGVRVGRAHADILAPAWRARARVIS